MNPLTRLSNNFRLSEVIKSDYAIRHNINNTPTAAIVDRLGFIVTTIAQPVRDHFNRSVRINSGYRCLELNRKLGSGDSSQHVTGDALDFEVSGRDNYETACWVRDNLTFDQLILEFYTGEPTSGWVHASRSQTGNDRFEILTITPSGTIKRGLHGR